MLSPALPANPHGVDAVIISSVLNPTPPPLLQQLPHPRGAKEAGEGEGSFIA